ncbi:S-norcoclaurine synthase 1 [Apostasia shenzhenica]|uniref:S-norcoclaurine synthase 1 n=1 Tax=Apostasia shenzhenica TaxID=1088818 RepID=A0A2I0AWZ4_9ASPA|nr:S-norcoclaurine synthase 1 [Apostasia shenzhenica]
MEGEFGIGRFGGSMPVESVQALTARLDKEIPERYIRPEMEEEVVSYINGDGDDEIPVIDFNKLVNPEFSSKEACKLHLACADWGFFQLINHGISEDTIEKMKVDITEFFKLPLEEKKKVAQPPGEIEGYGQAFVNSEDQKLDWADTLFLTSLPQHLRLMMLWPTNPPSFRETLNSYATEVKKVADQLFRAISKNLGVNSGKVADVMEGGVQMIKFNYYPPCTNPDKVIGLSPHSDAVGLTMLLQVSEVEGLQFRRDGGWLAVKPLPGAFIVNIGDVIEIMCNGKYKSVEHRAMVNIEKERLSIAAFHTVNFGDIVGPIPEMLEEGDHVRYKSLEFQEYMKQFYKSRLEGKSLLDRMKVNV